MLRPEDKKANRQRVVEENAILFPEGECGIYLRTSEAWKGRLPQSFPQTWCGKDY